MESKLRTALWRIPSRSEIRGTRSRLPTADSVTIVAPKSPFNFKLEFAKGEGPKSFVGVFVIYSVRGSARENEPTNGVEGTKEV